MKKRKITLIVVSIFIIFWILVIYKLSAMNSKSSGNASESIISIFVEDTIKVTNKYGLTNLNINSQKIDKVSDIINFPLRKVAHAFVYFVLSIMILFTINYIKKNKKYFWSLLISLSIIITLAGLDEFHQTFVDGRSGSIKDVIIDVSGAVIGIFIFSTYYLTYIRGYISGYKDKIVL